MINKWAYLIIGNILLICATTLSAINSESYSTTIQFITTVAALFVFYYLIDNKPKT